MSNITIDNGHLCAGKMRVKLADVDFIVPRKGWILKQYIFIGNRQGNFYKIRLDDNELQQVLQACRTYNAPMMENLGHVISCGNNVGPLAQGQTIRIHKNALWLTDDYVIFVPKRKILGFDSYPTSIEINNVRFSATSPVKKFGFFPAGYGTYFGTPDAQAVFKHPQKEDSEVLNRHLTKYGSPIGEETSVTFKDKFWLGKLLRPFAFRKHEEISLTDNAIIYKFKKGSKIDNIYLPLDKINYIDLKKGFIHSNYIRIYGEQNIMTHLQFSNQAIKQLKEIMKERHVEDAEAVIRPSFMFGLFRRPFARRSIFVLEDKIMFTDTKAKEVIALNAADITDICWKKKRFFYLVGYLFVFGIPENIRRDQHTEAQMFAIPKIWFTKKNLVKNMPENADYNNRAMKKLCLIEDVTYS